MKRNKIDWFLKRVIIDALWLISDDFKRRDAPKKRLCCQSGGVIREFYTFNFYQKCKPPKCPKLTNAIQARQPNYKGVGFHLICPNIELNKVIFLSNIFEFFFLFKIRHQLIANPIYIFKTVLTLLLYDYADRLI